MAAKVYRALGIRILVAKRSKYYAAALSHFEDAKRCYERSGLHRDWGHSSPTCAGRIIGKLAS